MDYSYIDENFKEINDRILATHSLSKREQEPSVLISIKSADIGEIEYLVKKHGVKIVGENRVQQLLERYDKLKELNLDIHFIGALQTNKVKYIIDKVSLIQSLDRIELAREIDKQAKKHGRIMDILVEINSGEEQNKSGVLPADAEALGVSDKEIVSVKLDTERALTFSNVVVRVSDKFALAMHIDTDEANAACAVGAVYGEIVK